MSKGRRMAIMSISKFTPDQKIHHLITWATEWKGERRGRSLWAYSLSLGGSHALMNDWFKNEKLLRLLTQEEKDLIREARERAARAWSDRG
ncbi:hypothetical protein [Streptomyces hyaluromycini]|uniref:hypothetical protein n=1 Tax=Streptomyces hyaluromycini TaxID=1377993 RepID=UPI0011AE743A|nr:hypothetical protein [Streptomyces hyaluromycini]